MEFLLVVGGLCALVVLAFRYGYDSRDALRSHEQVMAEFGFDWRGNPGRPEPAPRPRQIRPVRVTAYAMRHRLAIVLNALADWIYPPVERPAVASDSFDPAGHWA